jgi:integrase/recombinase XerD
MLLRLVHGRWPVGELPASALEAFHRDIVRDYDTWLRDLRGLHPETRAKHSRRALHFLASLGPRADLMVHDVDAHLRQCCGGLRRASIEDYAVCLRDFLRHLYRSGRTSTDLTGTVIRPRTYERDGTPSELRAEEVQRVLEVTREAPSPAGLRDYAVLMLLAIYGLRAAEIVGLQLEDIDWRRDVLRVRQSKTGTHSELPLLREAGEAMFRYLEKGRPSSAHRELFLRIHALHRTFKGDQSPTA